MNTSAGTAPVKKAETCSDMRKAVLSLLLALFALPGFCCTAVIISGKATSNGRPLMLKHRDTGQLDNAVGYFRGPVYSFIGLVNASSAWDGEVWTGTNEAGFCIMNTASYNIKDDDVPSSEMDKEGILMFRALGMCGSLVDFEYLLDTLSRPLGVEANFGVIDACGGAAWYEVNNHSWIKYDVNEMPLGYRVVTNFSESGRRADDRGVERYETATEIFREILDCKPYKVNHSDIFNGISRSFRGKDKGVAYIIPRKITSASIVLEGVAPGENPLHTVMWTILGYPPCGVALPLMVGNGCTLPHCVMPDGKDFHSQMGDLAMKRKVVGKEYPGIRQVEDKIEASFGKIYGKWLEGDISDAAFFKEYNFLKASFFDWYLEI